jgi:hypothetical protein
MHAESAVGPTASRESSPPITVMLTLSRKLGSLDSDVLGSMAVWRTKACELFGFPAIHHSYDRGKIELFAGLFHLAENSADDSDTVDQIADYVSWASAQTADELTSAVDLAFLHPMFRDTRIHNLFRDRFSLELLVSKRAVLMDEMHPL